jgi:hypothetical protein
MKIAWRCYRGVALAILALFPLALLANEPSSPSCPAIDVSAPIQAAPRLRAYIDPATGKLREPTTEELRQLAEERLKARAATPRVFEIVTHPNGMQSVHLGDAFLFNVRMETLPDGTAKIECVPPATRPDVEK